ncbi:MAG: Na+/H+ antiporter [Comamonadaceae bacterium]|nr:Na+/H+ antiporter [Comamonadaceae bacterium]
MILELTVFLLFCAAALGWVAHRFQFPYPIALVAGGAMLGLIPGLPQFPFDPQFILVLILPPVLYQAALMTSWSDFKAHVRPIGLLSIGLVIATTLAVGAALKLLVPEVPWAAAFVLGAIVSPPDAVAATAILSKLNIPRRVVTVLEGESLVNDASGLVIYKFAVAAVLTGAFSLPGALVQFGGIAVGGIVLGMAMAHVFIAIHRRLGDPFIEILISLLVPYATYIVAESLHASGVLALVAAGLVRGRYAPEIVSASMRILGRPAWQLVVFLLNSLTFMLIGLQMSSILDKLSLYSPLQLLALGSTVSLVAIGVRFVWVYAAGLLPGAWNHKGRPQQPPPNARENFIISWCGMRGIVSIAAALSLPLVLPNGSAFPHRDLIVFLTFFVIAVTLVVQGLSLPMLIRKLQVGSTWNEHEEKLRVRAAISAAALHALDQHVQQHACTGAWVASLRAEITSRIALAVPDGQDDGVHEASNLRLRHAVIQAERKELIRLWRNNQVSDDVMHRIEETLDHQEANL